MLNKLLKSVIDSDTAPVVICDLDFTIIYMNPASIIRYKNDLTGKSQKSCHNKESNQIIDKIIAWFKSSLDNNRVYTYRNDKENKDVYMIALRNENGELIGFYEKHEYRTNETSALYEM